MTDPVRFIARYEAVKDQKASSATSKYSEVWYSFLAPWDLHIGLMTRSKLMLSTEVYYPHYMARQFGFVQTIRTLSKFFMANFVRSRPPSKSATETDRLSALGNHLRRFFTPVSFRPNHMGVTDLQFQGAWEYFCDDIVFKTLSYSLHKILYT